ncbi:DUF6792 domain-containing protein [Listeria grayi]|uniref:DUF6792 domain-containing protein n=1 Tax=Listeria grayi TaxID=1641 RepID=UPI001625D303|nr:DUF6792 domain-containing protein [Listeria grayi]MBC1923020.1 hypothetical protein [Listeria grayi]
MNKLKDNQYWSLSKAGYSDLQIGSKIRDLDNKRWRVILKENTSNGYQGYAVVPEKDYKVDKTGDFFTGRIQSVTYKQVVIISKGTDPSKFGDLWTDAKYVVFGADKDKKPNQIRDAENFYAVVQKRFFPEKTYVTGHSLGGAISQDLSAEFQAEGVTFAAPNVYNILTPEAKKRVREGQTDRYMIDYTHDNEQIGLFSQWGAPLIGLQFVTKGNGHGINTFLPHFGGNGSAAVKVDPDETIQYTNRLKNIASNLDSVINALETYREEEEKEVKKMIRELKEETHSGGMLHLLSENDVEDAVREIARNKIDDVYRFHDEEELDALIQKLHKKKKELWDFGDMVGYAAHSFRDKDRELGSKITHALRKQI